MYGVLLLFWLIKATIGSRPRIAKPNCPENCGNVTIPYPFGIGSDCSANHTFTITCNNSKPFLHSINLEVLEIHLASYDSYSDSYIRYQTIRVNGPVTTSDCPTASVSRPSYLNLSATPFSVNNISNIFTGIGCNSVAQLLDATTNQGRTPIVECVSMCSNNDTSTNGSGCNGINCCQTLIPPISSKVVDVSLTSIPSMNSTNKSGCKYGFLVERSWFSNLTDPFAVQGMQNVPLVLDWWTDEKCYLCEMFDGYFNWSILDGYLKDCSDQKYCSCGTYAEGNGYLQNGCQGRSHTP